MGDGYDGANILLGAEVDREASITDSDSTNDEFTMSGDLTGDLSASPEENSEDTETDTFEVSDTSGDDGTYTVDSDPTYDSAADETTVPVSESISSDGETGTASYSVFSDVAVQTDLSVNNIKNIITADHKKKTFKNKIYGKRDGNVSLDALNLPPSRTQEAKQALMNAMDNEKEILMRKRDLDPDTNDVVIQEAPFLVNNVNNTHNDDSASNYSASLEQTDYWQDVTV